MDRSKLILDIREAHSLMKEFKGGYSNRFCSADDFAKALNFAIAELERGNDSICKDLWLWFAPTCDWDDFTGNFGFELGQRIYNQLEKNEPKYGILV